MMHVVFTLVFLLGFGSLYADQMFLSLERDCAALVPIHSYIWEMNFENKVIKKSFQPHFPGNLILKDSLGTPPPQKCVF